jgi:hypothetical protein
MIACSISHSIIADGSLNFKVNTGFKVSTGGSEAVMVSYRHSSTEAVVR